VVGSAHRTIDQQAAQAGFVGRGLLSIDRRRLDLIGGSAHGHRLAASAGKLSRITPATASIVAKVKNRGASGFPLAGHGALARKRHQISAETNGSIV